MNNTDIASDAIHLNKRIQLNYKGHVRKVEVHSVGLSKKGHPSIFVYQVDGGSNGQKQKGWKIMNLDEATSLTILDEDSEAPRSDYKGGVRGMAGVYAHVPFPPEAETITSHETQRSFKSLA